MRNEGKQYVFAEPKPEFFNGQRAFFEHRYEIYHYPADIIETVLADWAPFKLIQTLPNPGGVHHIIVHVYRLGVESADEEREQRIIMEFLEKMRIVASMAVDRDHQAWLRSEVAKHIADLPRRARLGGGNASQRRKRLRALQREPFDPESEQKKQRAREQAKRDNEWKQRQDRIRKWKPGR